MAARTKAESDAMARDASLVRPDGALTQAAADYVNARLGWYSYWFGRHEDADGKPIDPQALLRTAAEIWPSLGGLREIRCGRSLLPWHSTEGRVMATTRERFVEKFGEEQARAIETAAAEHSDVLAFANGRGALRRGTDRFKSDLIVAVGFECMSRDEFREHHGITVPWAELEAWIARHGHLATHDGDFDRLAKAIGAYDKFVGAQA